MKAITRSRYGPPEVLEIRDIEAPKPKANEILVRVIATTINRTDCGILLGKPKIIRLFVGLLSPSHLVPGTDFAGEVVSCGREVNNFKVGDRVWGLNDEGLQSHAEFMAIKATGSVVHIPKGISYIDAAASAEGAHYARNFLNKLKIKPEHKILVNGATGAIGSAGLQLLKANGNYVTAVANTKNIDKIKALNADRVIDYEKEDFTLDHERYDFVVDAVGKSTFGDCKKIMKENGIYISSELGPGGENLYLPFLTFFSRGKKVKFPLPTNTKKSINFMNQLLEQGKFKPLIDRHYKPHQIQEAYDYVLTGQKTGNVILDMA